MKKIDNIINEEINKFILKEFSWRSLIPGKKKNNNLEANDIGSSEGWGSLSDLDGNRENSQGNTESEDNRIIWDDTPKTDEQPELVTDPEENNELETTSTATQNNEIQTSTNTERTQANNYNYNTVNVNDYVDINGDYPISNALYKLVQNKKLRNSSRIFNVMKDLEAIGW